MPTGYTYPVAEGKVTALREFAMQCARGMGALVTMRDDPSDAPIPDKFTANTKYHDDALAEADKVLAEVPALSDAECDTRAAAAFTEAMQSHTQYAIDKAQQKRRYEEMIFHVERWKVPQEIVSLKDFMLEQLRDSLDHDCGGSYRPDVPVRLTGEQWREKALAAASRDVAYHTVERQKEIDRTEARNKWLVEFFKALPAATP